MNKWITLVVGVVLCVGCSAPSSQSKSPMTRPSFNADSAYSYVSAQVNFGPRVPDSKAHTECAVWLVQQLKRFGAEVTLQQGRMINYAGHEQQIYNIIASFVPQGSQEERILLAAHYDSRPWCDEEDEYSQRFQGVPGANDGASGVGVLLEIARQLGIKQANNEPFTPTDIVLFDCEDMGTPAFYTGQQRENTWCLGSQLWAREYAYGTEMPLDLKYRFGVLLDMVGAPDAVFPKEYYSVQFANDYVETIWRIAQRLGHGRYFSAALSYPITDDHYYVNTTTGIPMVDIIHYDARGNAGFASWWHTTEDDMQHIDRNTLQAVGEVVMSLL